jgi:hypothetical protein
MLRIEIAATDHQGAVNEDVVGHCGDAAWVIDGATGIGASLLEEPSDAAWLAQTASRFLADVLRTHPAMPMVDVLRSVMAQCGEALLRQRVREPEGHHELPSAAFAMVRAVDGMAEITTLADCRVVAADADGVARLWGSSAGCDRRAHLAALREILAEDPAITPDALKERLMPGLVANRRLMNRDGGYWVLGTEPAAADHVWQARIPLRVGQRFAIASDGFLRLAELFDVAGPADFLAIRSADEWRRWIDALRALERAPGSLRRFARVKPHDDASLVVCRWEETD